MLVFFRFTVLTAVHLQNVNAKFHKVVHYSGEAENVYIYVRQFYHSRLNQSDFVDCMYIKKHFDVFFSVHGSVNIVIAVFGKGNRHVSEKGNRNEVLDWKCVGMGIIPREW